MARPTPPTVLVVDDEPLVRTLLRRILTLEGYRVIEAVDGPSALDALREQPDLVVLDVMLDGESGLDVLAAIRSENGVPVILVTGFDDEDARSSAERLEAADYVVKPFAADDFTARVARVLRPDTRLSGSRLRTGL